MSHLFVNSWYFNNNWVISCVLVNLLRAMAHNIIETMKMMLGHFFVVVVLYYILIFLFFTYLAKPIFQETSTKINTKNCQCYCKNKSTTILLSTLLPTIEVKSKFHNFAVKPLACNWALNILTSFLFSCQEEYRPWQIIFDLFNKLLANGHSNYHSGHTCKTSARAQGLYFQKLKFAKSSSFNLKNT